jgi:hypothetical protein
LPASLQGANTTTLDVDLWFETTSDPRIAEAARAAPENGSFRRVPRFRPDGRPRYDLDMNARMFREYEVRGPIDGDLAAAQGVAA